MSLPQPITRRVRHRASASARAVATEPACAAERRRLRQALREGRRALPAAERQAAEARIAAAIVAHPWFEAANRILAYRSFDGEVDLSAVLAHALAAGKQVLFARTTPDAPLAFVVPWRWRVTAHGCPVPDGPEVAIGAGDLMLVPGVGFTRAGQRLGLGGGHYDRTLAGRAIRSIGIAFSDQIVPRLPASAWDQPVDRVLTEGGLIRPCTHGAPG